MRDAQSMLQWPHSGFHVHDAVWVAEDDRGFASSTGCRRPKRKEYDCN